MYEDTIARFEAFLQERRLAPSERVRFYGHWVHRFLCFARDEKSSDFDGCFLRFSALLREGEERPDWQVGQARDAVRIYYHQFRQTYPKTGSENGPKSTGSPSSNSVPTGMEAALERMKEELRLRGLSLKTEEAYLGWAGRFYRYRNRVGLGNRVPQPNDMKAFLTHLALEGNVSKSTQNQAFNGLLFLFRHVLKVNVEDLNETPRAKRGRRLPVALSPDETLALINAADGPEARFTIELIYGTGMRLQEFCRLRVRDIDFDMRTIRIIAGKGDKDRTVMLPEHLADGLRARIDQAGEIHEHDLAQGYGEVWLPDALSRKYRSAARSFAWQYVFPSGKLSVDPRGGMVRRQHIHRCTIQRQVEAARKRAGIQKHITPHSLRHSFATHLLMSNVEIHRVQEYLGHERIETTMIYLHIIREMCTPATSPLDLLLRGTLPGLSGRPAVTAASEATSPADAEHGLDTVPEIQSLPEENKASPHPVENRTATMTGVPETTGSPAEQSLSDGTPDAGESDRQLRDLPDTHSGIFVPETLTAAEAGVPDGNHIVFTQSHRDRHMEWQKRPP